MGLLSRFCKMIKKISFVPALLSFVVYGTNLVFTTASYSSFNKEMVFERLEGFQLVGHTIENLDTDEFGCGLRCLRNQKCRSYNSLIGGNHGNVTCQISSHTRKSSPQSFRRSSESNYYEIRHGWYSSHPGRSCKHIRDSGSSKGDGEYWIDPENDGNPLKVFCDMTTDGGGWLLVTNVVMPDNSTLPSSWTAETSYRGISKYHNKRMGITTNAMNELKARLSFTQLRFHCNKQQGRRFHVATVANSAGAAVVQYFSGETDERPLSCNSYQKMDDDSSQLAVQCDKWGFVGKWGNGVFINDRRMYHYAAFVPGLYHWFVGSTLFCDDYSHTATLSAGDLWKIFVR